MNETVGPATQLSPLATDLAEWLATRSLGDFDYVSLFDEFCQRLVAIGIPIRRAHFSFRTLHPLFEATGCTWEYGKGCSTEDFEHQTEGTMRERWRNSPLRYLVETRLPTMRRRLTGPDALVDFPTLEEYRDDGYTDWIGYVVAFDNEGKSGMVGSWGTDRPSGFSDTHLSVLKFLERPLAVAVKVAAQQQLSENVVHTYLGPIAGRRVLQGQIKRGDGETIPAVIWYSDLRGSTQMAEALDRDDYTALLNVYFEAMGDAITSARGELLDFIGDAVLAIFPIENGDTAVACERALDAAVRADQSLAAANECRAGAGLAPLSFGLALHVGEVMFGNIGTAARLVFSVIGASVNEVARLQDMTKTLGRHVVVSGAFADVLERPWEDLGEHSLPGVSRPMRICAPPAGD